MSGDLRGGAVHRCSCSTMFTLVVLLSLVSVDANCVWYGIGDHSVPEHPKYRNYTGPGRPLNDSDAFKTLSKLCPNYATSNDAPLCCDKDQIEFFSTSIKAAYELLHRCPACYANLRLLLCAMTCDPDQSDFITPVVMEPLVLSIEFRLTEVVGNALYNSCKDVQFSGSHAIDPICGTTCSAELFLKGLGGDQSPFPVNYRMMTVNDTSTVFNAPFYKCNGSVPRRHSDLGGPACSCLDCEASCIPPLPPPEPESWPTIFGIDAWWVGSFFAFVLLAVVFLTFEIATHVYRKRHITPLHTSLDDDVPLPSHHRDSCLLRLQAKLENLMCRGFSTLGRSVARHPYFTLLISIILSAALSAGLACFKVTTNPVELWSGPQSRSRLEKEYFDQSFRPFYRTEQIIFRPLNQSFFEHANLYPASGTGLFGPALKKDFLDQVLLLQTELRDFSVYSPEFNRNISLSDVCFKPLAPDNLECAITSVLEYFQSDPAKLNATKYDEEFPDLLLTDYIDHMLFCAHSPLSVSGSPVNTTFTCLGSSGMPIQPNVVFGGFNNSFYQNATSLVITFLVNNNPSPTSEQVRLAEVWEAEYLRRIKSWSQTHANLTTVSYQAERSVEDEINRQSEADVSTVSASYLVMFVYVSIFLASYRSWRTVFVDMRITLGLGGVLIVVLSVVASVGFWSYIGIPATLIIIEVIPFLVLAVGVDNIFILVNDFDSDDCNTEKVLRLRLSRRSDASDNPLVTHSSSDDAAMDEPELNLPAQLTPTIRSLVEVRIARTMGRVGPSLLLSSSAEAVAFFCGSLTTMPAVRVFALYAGVALVINLLLQLFAFVALLTLDARRRAANRFDVLCCLGLRDTRTDTAEVNLDESVTSNSGQPLPHSTYSLSLKSNVLDEVQLPLPEGDSRLDRDTHSTPWLHLAIARGLTPVLLSGWVRPIVFVLSLVWMCFAIAIIPQGLHIGLDQRLSMPDDSYVLDYFNAIARDLRVGPPLYFVVTAGHEYNTTIGQNQICGTTGCPQTSLMGRVADASKLATYTWIAQPASSWLDDYFDWVDPDGSPFCCRVYRNGSGFCPDSAPAADCITCPVTMVDGRPTPEDFTKYLGRFLDQNPGVRCAKGGRAAYHTAVQLGPQNSVGATYFMTYHSVLSDPDDFINALRGARRVANEINHEWHTNTSQHSGTSDLLAPNSVFPYSVFYVFYEQYLTVMNEAGLQIGVCVVAITAVTFLLLGLNFAATFMVLIGVVYIVLSIVALMVLWKIELNAISLVNLVVTVGIAVEFCAHMVRAFTVSAEPSRIARAKAALTDMGSSILRGITLTKLGGITILAFSKSRLFQIFYFRMYLGIILFGAYTGLILLPVILSYFGPGLNETLAKKRMERFDEGDTLGCDRSLRPSDRTDDSTR